MTEIALIAAAVAASASRPWLQLRTGLQSLAGRSTNTFVGPRGWTALKHLARLGGDEQRAAHDERTDEKPTPHDAAEAAGEDGYIDPDSGLWVFTAGYHLRRGHCCDNGCRHCPYDDNEMPMISRYADAPGRWARM